MAQTPETSPFESIPRWAWAAITVAVLAFAVLAIYLIVFWPHGMAAGSEQLPIRQRFDMVNEKRRTAVQIIGGLSLIATGLFTAWNAHSARVNARAALKNAEAATKNAQFAEAKQVSERFIKATENLDSSKSLSTRVGAIYSLESVARESVEYHRTVFEVLADVVYETSLKKKAAHEKRLAGQSDKDDEAAGIRPLDRFPDSDVQAALKVIGRRLYANDRGLRISLHSCYLPNARLVGDRDGVAHSFDNVDFTECNIEHAFAHGCSFKGASFVMAEMNHAVFIGADLTNAKFQFAEMDDVTFENADLTNADMRAVDLSTCRKLTQKQINTARLSRSTKLPDGLVLPENANHWDWLS